MIPLEYKGYSSVIGAVIIDLVLGSVYTWSNINSYFVSYLKLHDSPTIELVDGYFLMPIIIFISNIATYFGPKIDAKIGVKKCVSLTLVMVVLAHLMLLSTTKLSMVYCAMIIFGVAIGFSYMAVMRNAWLYFPDKKGLISGVILFGYGLSALIFTWVSDSIVNPKFEKVSANGFFAPEIANRTYNFIFALNVILVAMSIIGYLMIFDYYTLESSKEQNVNSQVNNIGTAKKAITSTSSEIRTNTPIKEVFSGIQVYQIIAMNFCTLYFCYMVTNTNRSFGQLNTLNEGLLSTLSKTFSLINGGGRILWGILFDKFGFKSLYILLVITEIFISASIFYVGQNGLLYFALVCVTAFLLAGNISLMVPLYPKIYGTKYGPEVNGIAVALYGFSCLLGPIIAKFLIHEKSDYKTLYFSGTFMAILSLITVFTFDEKRFKFHCEEGEKSIKDGKEKMQEISTEMLINKE